MKTYLTIILIGLVSGFIGIIPLLRKKADKYTVLAGFVLFLLMPYRLSLESSLGTLVVERYGSFPGIVSAADYRFRQGKFALCFSAVDYVGGGGIVHFFFRTLSVVR